jgi:hypothetical protein
MQALDVQVPPVAPARTKKGHKRARAPPTGDDYVKVVPLQVQDDHSLPIQVFSRYCLTPIHIAH